LFQEKSGNPAFISASPHLQKIQCYVCTFWCRIPICQMALPTTDRPLQELHR
jgi:hypothetical protein